MLSTTTTTTKPIISSTLKEVKTANGTSIYIISKCIHCRKEFDIVINEKYIEASCRNCFIWKRY